MTAVGLVTIYLELYHPSTYFQPSVLLQSLSLMPQLEVLVIYYRTLKLRSFNQSLSESFWIRDSSLIQNHGKT